MLVLALMLVGAGGYLWRFERARVDAWLGLAAPEAPQVASIANETPEAPAPRAESPVAHASRALAEALSASQRQLATAQQAQRAQQQQGAITEGAKRLHSAQARALREGTRPDPKALTRAGKRALEQRQLARARALFHEAIELDGRNAEAIAGLGWTLLSLGELDTSAAQFRRALAADARHGDAYIGLGKVERARGKLWEALAAYEDYLSRYPRGPQASIASHQRVQLKQALGL